MGKTLIRYLRDKEDVCWITVYMYILMLNIYFRLVYIPVVGIPLGLSLFILIILCIVLGYSGFKVSSGHYGIFAGTVTTVLIPFEIYTWIAYWNWLDRRIYIILSFIALIACFVLWNGIFKKLKEGKNKEDILEIFIKKCVVAAKEIVAMFFIILLVAAAVKQKKIYGTVYLQVQQGQHAKESECSLYTDADSLENNIETVKMLQEDSWIYLDEEERVKVLQVIADIAGYNMGLSSKLKVKVKDVEVEYKRKEYIPLAYYNIGRKTIVVHEKNLNECTGEEAAQIILHECRHGYQDEMICLYRRLDKCEKNLMAMKKVGKWKYEFEHYIRADSKDKYEEYYNQESEKDARDYAAKEIDKYINKIH